MLNDEVGKDFRARSRKGDRQRSRRDWVRVLIVDPVIGSRLLLADAVVQAGFVAVTASNATDARITLEREKIVLILADENVSGAAAGLHFLIELRKLFPGIPRALMTQSRDLASMGKVVEQAEISFLLAKPLDVSAFRDALRNVLLGNREFGGWDQVALHQGRTIAGRIDSRLHTNGTPTHPTKDFRHEMILRGLLAGLNSVEFEDRLFSLLDLELAEEFQVERWLCVDEKEGNAKRVRRDWRVAGDAQASKPSPEEVTLIREAQRFDGVRRLVGGDGASRDAAERNRLVCLGFVLEEAGSRALTCLVWCDAACGATLLEMLRDLRHGLKLTLRRIRDAERRAEEARQLAHRVSEELKSPVGALTHALDRMRGEAVRAGMSTESLDRVLSESHRVFQAVDHLKDEMSVDRPIAPAASN